MIPVKLYLQLMKVITEYYNEYTLNSDLCVDLTHAMIPICEKITKGAYNYKGKKNG